jgi:hypothetical protein
MKQQALIGDIDPSARRAFDFYPTPRWMTEALLRRCRPFGPVLEPAAGDGAISNVLRAHGLDVVTNDLDPARSTDFHHDIRERAAWSAFSTRGTWWGITNLPFNVADQVVPLAVDNLNYFASVLRLSWLEPTAARQLFLKHNPPDKLIIMPRTDFKGKGQTDSVTSAWFVWNRYQASDRGIEVVTKDERDALIAMHGAA